eukprot:6475736-Amphidinium_carterae.1
MKGCIGFATHVQRVCPPDPFAAIMEWSWSSPMSLPWETGWLGVVLAERVEFRSPLRGLIWELPPPELAPSPPVAVVEPP